MIGPLPRVFCCVRQGDVIAQVGATGRVTGPHLDWRMNWFNYPLDPQLLVEPMPEQSKPEQTAPEQPGAH